MENKTLVIFTGVTQQVNKNNEKLNNVLRKLQNEKSNFKNQSSIIISQIHKLNKKLVNGSDENNSWQQLFIKSTLQFLFVYKFDEKPIDILINETKFYLDNLSQLGNLDEKLHTTTTTLNVETNEIRKMITEIKSLENGLDKAIENFITLKSKTDARMISINFKLKSSKSKLNYMLKLFLYS